MEIATDAASSSHAIPNRLRVVARGASERTRIRIARMLAEAGFHLTSVVADDGCTFLEAQQGRKPCSPNPYADMPNTQGVNE